MLEEQNKFVEELKRRRLKDKDDQTESRRKLCLENYFFQKYLKKKIGKM